MPATLPQGKPNGLFAALWSHGATAAPQLVASVRRDSGLPRPGTRTGTNISPAWASVGKSQVTASSALSFHTTWTLCCSSVAFFLFPLSQEPLPHPKNQPQLRSAVLGSSRVGVCCSSGRAGAGQDLGTRGRCLYRQAELSVLTVTSQQDPPFFFFFPFLCCLFCILLGEADSRLVAALRFRRDAAAALAPPWLSPGAAHPRGCSLPSLALTRGGAGVSVLVLHQGMAARGPGLWPFTGRSQHWETSKQKPLDKLRVSPGGVGHPSSTAPSLFLGAPGGFGALPGPHPGSGPAAAACQAKGPRRGSCCHRADGESFCLAFPRGDAITRCCHPSTQGFATAWPAAGARPCSLLLFHTSPAAPGVAELP